MRKRKIRPPSRGGGSVLQRDYSTGNLQDRGIAAQSGDLTVISGEVMRPVVEQRAFPDDSQDQINKGKAVSSAVNNKATASKSTGQNNIGKDENQGVFQTLQEARDQSHNLDPSKMGDGDQTKTAPVNTKKGTLAQPTP